MKWADKYRKLGVRTNADTPAQAKMAVELGAEGIGLCRTEHMFFEGDRIDAVREMILASDLSERQKALDKLLPYQRKDFEGIFRAMDGLPVTVRLLDPPLHEFLPHESSARAQLAEKMNVSPEIVAERCKALEEQNPMLGHRGCRLGNSYPEITRMQARAIFEAAANVMKGKKPVKVKVEIMVPARRIRAGAQIPGAEYPRGCGGSDGEQEGQDRLHARHHDRGSARRADRRQNRARRRSSSRSAQTTSLRPASE